VLARQHLRRTVAPRRAEPQDRLGMTPTNLRVCPRSQARRIWQHGG
jgi:hypothetical protein